MIKNLDLCFQVCNLNPTHFDSLIVDQKFHLIMRNGSNEVTTQVLTIFDDSFKRKDKIAIKS